MYCNPTHDIVFGRLFLLQFNSVSDIVDRVIELVIKSGHAAHSFYASGKLMGVQ